ncbi:MAG TPA: hypothetical protein VFL91_28250 [Thermomicrobiales bacterium]|nr:hypothetical protein [Thermomicrobiales bacterium]
MIGTSPRRPVARPARHRRGPWRQRVRRWREATRRALWAPAAPAPAPPPEARQRALLRHHLLPLGLYLALTAVMTYPLLLRFTTSIPGDGVDGLMNLWGYWWTKVAVFGLHNPFVTPLVYAPEGAPLYLHTLNLLNGLITLPVQALFGPIVAYNTVVFLSFTLAGYCAYLLVAYVGGNRLAAFAGGVIYAFGSYQFTHLLGHANLFASEWLPAYALCLLAALDATGRRRTLLALAAVGALVLITLTDWQYVLFAVLFTVLYALYATATRRSPAPLVASAAIGCCWLLLALPLLIPTIAETRSGIAEPPGLRDSFNWSADLVSFFVPSPLQSLWGGWAERTIGHKVWPPPNERAIFLGYLPLVLGALGLRWGRRRAAFWALAALVFGVLALGPDLQILGRWRFGRGDWPVPLPYGWLQALPVLDFLRVPARFALMVTLALAVLSGIALAALGRRLPARLGLPARVALLAVLVGALLLEHVAVPYPMQALGVPAFYQQLARSPEQGTIYEVPFSLKRPLSLYYQTAHGRPLIGGYLSRRLAYPLRDIPPLANPGRDITPAPADPADLGRWALAYSDVHWIVVLRNDPRLDRATLPAFIAAFAQPVPLYTDADTLVYRPLPPGEPVLYVEPGDGWYDAEPVPGTDQLSRWFADRATFDAWSFANGPQAAHLRFDAWAFHSARRLEVRVDGRVVGVWRVADTQRFDIPLTLTTGYHQIELRSLEPPVTPSSVGYAVDGRPLSFQIRDVTLTK